MQVKFSKWINWFHRQTATIQKNTHSWSAWTLGLGRLLCPSGQPYSMTSWGTWEDRDSFIQSSAHATPPQGSQLLFLQHHWSALLLLRNFASDLYPLGSWSKKGTSCPPAACYRGPFPRTVPSLPVVWVSKPVVWDTPPLVDTLTHNYGHTWSVIESFISRSQDIKSVHWGRWHPIYVSWTRLSSVGKASFLPRAHNTDIFWVGVVLLLCPTHTSRHCSGSKYGHTSVGIHALHRAQGGRGTSSWPTI